MRKSVGPLLFVLALGIGATIAAAQEFAQGERRNLLKMETTDLPQGKAVIRGGERMMPPGGRSPWHTSGPKLLYVLDGTLAVEGLAGQTLLTCGPGPKLCFNPAKGMWFNRNAGQGLVRFVIIGIDAVEHPTIHEMVGQVTAISGEQVTLAVGDVRTSELAVPRREVKITVSTLDAIAVGDNVVTVRHDEKAHRAEGLVRLAQRWR